MSEHLDDDDDDMGSNGEGENDERLEEAGVINGEEEEGEEEEGEGEEEEEVGEGDVRDPEEVAEEEEDKKIVAKSLTLDAMKECLSLLCKTDTGLAHALVQLNASKRKLTDISLLSSFQHLRYINLDRNNLKDLTALASLTNLLTLSVDRNKLTSLMIGAELPYLQHISARRNRIKTFDGIRHPMLAHLNLNDNKIASPVGLDPEHLKQLQTLELRSNRLDTLKGFNLPNLKRLFIACNRLTSLEGLDEFTSLTLLHARSNAVERLDGGDMSKLLHLQNINLRMNNIADLSETKKLEPLKELRVLVLAGNACCEGGENYRDELCANLQGRLVRIDKDACTDEEKMIGLKLYEERRKEEEEERLLKDEQEQEKEDEEDDDEDDGRPKAVSATEE